MCVTAPRRRIQRLHEADALRRGKPRRHVPRANPVELRRVAGAILAISSLHLLYINTRFLPSALRPPLWRRVALVCMSAFYCFFAFLSFKSLL